MERLALSKFRKVAHMELQNRLDYVQILRRQVVTYKDIKALEGSIDHLWLQKLDQQQRDFLKILEIVHSIQLQRYKRDPDYWNAFLEGMTVQEYRNSLKESVWDRFLSVLWRKQKKQQTPVNQKPLPKHDEIQMPRDKSSFDEGLLTKY